MDEPKSILIRRLENLLGFDDGADDILEHLLPIDSNEDLRDYLSQLLGLDSENDDVQIFVKEVWKYKRGEKLLPLERGDEAKLENEEKKDDSPARARASVVPPKRRNINRQKKQKEKRKGAPKVANGAIKKHDKKSNTKIKKSLPIRLPEEETDTPTKMVAKLEDPPPPENTATCTETETIEEKRPIKGKASYVCGCFGTVHRALTNCLHCGRISCIKEGYDYCPFCGFLIEDVGKPTENGKIDLKAWQHKERLLRFDRETASRTKIWDDQEDYFSSSKSEWLSSEEKAAALEKESERNKALHERPNQKLSIVF